MEKPRIQIGYRDRSEDQAKCCEQCFNFQPLQDDDGDGRCFGTTVSAVGACDIFTARKTVEAGMSEARLS